MQISDSLLGKATRYKNKYDNNILFRIPRKDKRKELGLDSNKLPFHGVDIWNAYEISWLDMYGKPCVAIGRFDIPANSVYIVESKSMKLYLNSFNNDKFQSKKMVSEIITQDLSNLLECKIDVYLYDLASEHYNNIDVMPGYNIDHLQVNCTEYDTANPQLIQFDDFIVTEEINSNLLKSNCLITNQPDWASVSIQYTGKKLKRDSVIQYLVSLRDHNEFHEQCVERIFCDIFNRIKPQHLAIYARYTRRGGVDICPYRTNDINFFIPNNTRLSRQ